MSEFPYKVDVVRADGFEFAIGFDDLDEAEHVAGFLETDPERYKSATVRRG